MSVISRFFRIFRRHAVQSFINLFGLAFGMAVFLAIQLYIYNERDYDSFWLDGDRIYKIGAVWNGDDGIVNRAAIPPPVGPYLKENAGIEAVTRLVYWSDFTMRPDTDSSRVFRETRIYQADSSFFRVFGDRLLYGDADTALKGMFNIVLSEDAARKYFGDMPFSLILGRNLLGGKDGGTPWKITGIMENLPDHSHLDFEMLVPMWEEFAASDNWSWHVMHTYAKLSTSDAASLETALKKTVTERIIPHYVQEGFLEAVENSEDYHFSPIAISNVHLQPQWEGAMKGANDEAYLEILNLVSLLVFLLACINFINISTSLAFYRTTEIGIRKIHGSGRWRLFWLILSEYFIYAVLALGLGLGLNELLLIGLDKLFNFELHLTPLQLPQFMAVLCAILILTTLIAASYPAYLLVRGKSVRLTRGSWKVGEAKLIREGLIVFQFFIAVFLIGFSITIGRQLAFMQDQHVGFNRENLLIIQNDREIEEQRESFVNSLNELSPVQGASFSSGVPALLRYHIRDVKIPGSDEHFPMQWYEIDEHYIDVMNIELAAGANFTGLPADSGQVILNQTAAQLLGLTDAPLGRLLVINEGSEDERRLTVAGVVNDFYQEGFRREVQPLILEYLDNFTFKDYVSVRFTGEAPAKLADQIEDVWATFEPGVPMSYSYLQGNYGQLFLSEVMLSRVFRFFSILSLVIASLGLLGVTSVALEQQTREIGIRKIFGASRFTLVGHQMRKFIWLVVIGLVLAIPVSWWISVNWLESFAYKVDVRIWTFLLAGASVLVITIVIVGVRTWLGTLKNPIESLRTE